MRKVLISENVDNKISELELYLKNTLKFSQEAARNRSDRMRDFVKSLNGIANYPLCRFKKWRKLGYHCIVFEKNWIFAYEIYDNGIIIQDMSHTARLVE